MEGIVKLAAVVKIKWIGISRNMSIVIAPIMTIGLVYMFRILYGRNSGGELSPAMISIILNIGLSMSICSDGFLMVGTTIAEEKEKHTLRVLMTSSVTGVQYFIGSILLPFILTVGVNLAVLFFSGIPMEQVSLPIFLFVNMIAAFISCVIGMIIGICAKNQMNANMIASPFLMIFMMVPVLGGMSEGLHRLSGYLFTGVLTEMTEAFANGKEYTLQPLNVAVLFLELVISVLVFLSLYKRNGYEGD